MLTGAQVTQLCLTLDALLENENGSAEVLECYFLEALYCSLGATLMETDRSKFDEFIKRLSGLTTVQDEKELAGPGEIPGKNGKQQWCHFTIPLFQFVQCLVLILGFNKNDLRKWRKAQIIYDSAILENFATSQICKHKSISQFLCQFLWHYVCFPYRLPSHSV